MVDLSILDPVKADLLAECKKVKAEGRHSVFLLLTDIMTVLLGVAPGAGDPAVRKEKGRRAMCPRPLSAVVFGTD